ncbi:AAA domain-containing protein [Noviherbaspirillum pedocola]|uniref:AAA family ATPase n=1 Tax=Noviherbaspirillum pedocola TaxID=2801341 RepID=A0A934SWS2_9BURK|nr:AAA domain-containing protein [Noviherbaspirillum pedocola]MBK4736790.1 AAA family ATPase [Noviherbaspirillum pedocola]
MNEASPRVLDLLTYIEQVEKLKTKPSFSVPTEYFVAHQHELQGLPELQFNLQAEGDDVWLRVPRLQEIPAPDLDDKLRPWTTLPKSPEKIPELKSECVAYDGKREVSRELLNEHPEIKQLFDWYVEYQWEPWAAAERPRRKAIARYNQLFALQQAITSEGAETPIELVWGIGYAAWKKEGFGTAVKHPLLVQSCEITLNEKTFDLEIRPRDVEPRLEADCYAEMELPGVRPLEAFWKSTLATGAHRVNPFEASTFEGVLKAAVGHLDPSGAYEVRSDDVTPPTPDAQLKITNTWVLFGRKRTGDIFLEDIRRLKKSVEAAPALPGVIRSFVEHGDSTVRVRPEQPFRGLSSSDSPTGAFELYFPMPYNDEQVSIVQKLESNDGVVVQGPPGTGKTHTIANVISHYLTQGKRVLVTAKGESALAVLQEKLPERIRPLSIALLSDERDGMKQFEHSIQTIASSVASLNPARAQSAITALEEKLNTIHAKIAGVNQTVTAFAAKHMRNYSFQGKDVSPEEMAKSVLQQAEEHEWFDDAPPAMQDQKLPFTDSDITVLRQARIKVGADLCYLGCSLPMPGDFPAWPNLLELHRDLVKARTIETNVSQGSILPLVDARLETLEKVQILAKFIEDRTALLAKLDSARQAWVNAFGERLGDMKADDPLLKALNEVCTDIENLEGIRKELVSKAVELPAGAELNNDFNDALTRLVAGKSAFSLPFGKGEARKLISTVTVLGMAPKSADEWEFAQRLCKWRVDARKALARWNSMSGEFGLEPASDAFDAGFKAIVAAKTHIVDMQRLVFEFDAKLHGQLSEVFGKQVADRIWDEGEPFLNVLSESLEAHADKGRLAYAMNRMQELLRKLEGRSGGITDEIRSFLASSIGRISADEAVLQTTWGALQSELTRLVALLPSLAQIQSVALQLDAAGAVKWASRVRIQPAAGDHDPLVPVTWLEAWNWRQAALFLEKIDEHQRLRSLFEERKTLTTALARTYQDLVAEKTWLGVFNNSPDSVRQALQAYLNAVQAMGSGTGVRAIRHRKTARDAMLRAYQAVPCWVLPQWRVSETIPAEVGLFDLVVVDEASQSDIWALPALLRGKKLLVVGDHKQVSPSAVGTAEEKIKELSNRFLGNQPHGAQMTPDKSIYDLARVVFAGNSVMLKEHFRCVPAIIEFSNREFYEGDIKPLRLPKANERLDPPLVDVFVKGGFRKGDVNPVEAEAIVGEIEAILADELFNGRSIGVVTLLGTAQAAHIQELVSNRILPADVLARKIAVGPPPVFQGRERDIMMVSMVLAPGDRAAQNKVDMYQRFNVALSRARDRMYLFRSVTETTFKEDTLNSRLIRHFRQPFRQESQKIQSLREKCESGFELEMFDELVKRGYRVQPQVPCGGYRIDFVVEGNEGRRLAIECDGDRFHGPEQWSDDMARQRVLERAGWTFWRCFASSFVRRREEVLQDLLQTLSRLGIEPLGAESVDSTVWVHAKEVDPYGIDEEQEVAQ